MKTHIPKWNWTIIIAISMSLASSHTVHGETNTNKESEIRLGIPGWISGVDGTVGVRDREGNVDESFTDILDVLDFTAALNLEVRKSRWLFFADGLYLKTTTEAEPRGLLSGVISNVELEQRQVIGNVGIGYAVIKNNSFTLEVFGGARLNYLEAELSLELPGSQPTFDGSKFWVDPIVGLRAEYSLSEHVALYAKGDIGGFGVSSDLTWQAEGGFDFKLTHHTYLRLAYRFLHTDFEDGGFTYDMDTGGPLLEFGFRF